MHKLTGKVSAFELLLSYTLVILVYVKKAMIDKRTFLLTPITSPANTAATVTHDITAKEVNAWIETMCDHR